MNKYLNLSFLYLLIAIFFFSCQHKLSKSELDALEEQRIDSLMKEKKAFAKDSISKRGDTLFAGFRLGMTEKEYNYSVNYFKKETNGYIELLDLSFSLYNPTYDNGKLSCLALGATDIVDIYNGNYCGIDYFTLLKDYYSNKLGLPDLFLNQDDQETGSNSKDVVKVLWSFDNRVIVLSNSDHIMDNRVSRNYFIYYYTPEEWIKTKESFDKIYLNKKREKKEIEEKGKKYSNEL